MKKRWLFPSMITIFIIIVTGWYILSSSKASDFQLVDINGNYFRLSNFKGKIVILEFMATQCVLCRQQIPYLIEVWEKYRDSIAIISISVDPLRDSDDVLRDFIKRYPNATWIWARDTVNLTIAYKVTAIPKIVIIDKEGNIRFEHLGITSSTIIIQEINKLLR
ncbi:MAG: TlpA family protein disulfide reductase [Candidatus Methanomethyliaceae archaeon]|nr:TlpA family protein disulfide reductase [Candidatus Methanomethyliaceae archaeon]MDW7970611.1 TlpA disulfide reductase family protein [Nitrososphaerota archaeon]